MAEILATDKWIIDGDYSRTYEVRINACDTVIFSDYPTEQCIYGIQERVGQKRDDCPCIQMTDSLLDKVNRYFQEKRPIALGMLDMSFQKKIYVFKTRLETESWLSSLEKQQEKN